MTELLNKPRLVVFTSAAALALGAIWPALAQTSAVPCAMAEAIDLGLFRSSGGRR